MDFEFELMSLINTIRNSGLTIKPCGTPKVLQEVEHVYEYSF